MPKAKFADRGKPKPKSIKAKTKLSSKRKLSRFGKKQKAGHAGEAVNYIGRTKAVKKLQISLKDFRRLCILKGIYPRDPKNKKAGNTQTYYHVKDISYLAHEPLLAKFREFKTFLKRMTRALGRRDMDEARRIYSSGKPSYTLDHLIKERYPRFEDALGDLDDALSLTHLIASLPAVRVIKPARTAAAQRFAREWQYFVARSHSLRKVFLSVKGVYLQAEVKGVAVTWLVPWSFAQWVPGDVDFKVMLTFMDLYETLLAFVHFKLFHQLGLAYPPAIRADVEAVAGGTIAAVDAVSASAAAAAGASSAGAGSSSSGSAMAVDAGSAASKAAAARIASLQAKMKSIAAADAAASGSSSASAAAPASAALSSGKRTGDAAAAAPSASGVGSKRPRQAATKADAAAAGSGSSSSAGGAAGGAAAAGTADHSAFASLYDAFAAEDAAEDSAGSGAAGAAVAGGAGIGAGAAAGAAGAGEDSSLVDMAAFADSDEARAVVARAQAMRRFQRLFAGLVFFLNREVPREVFEFIIVAFRGRVGWDGPGSPYAPADPRITHHVVDRPMAAAAAEGAAAADPCRSIVGGRTYVQPQWVADSINARMLLPAAKYAPGAALPPHLSPFVDDAREGYVPAYRHEIERLRAAAAVTGRLADTLDAAKVAAAHAAAAAEATGGSAGGPPGKRARIAAAAKAAAASAEDAEELDEDGHDDDDEDDEDDDDDDGSLSSEEDEEDGAGRRAAYADADEEEDDDDVSEGDIDDAMKTGAPLKKGSKGKAVGGAGAGKGGKAGAAMAAAALKLTTAEAERRALAASMLPNKKRKLYERVAASAGKKQAAMDGLAAKAAAAAARGDSGVGAAAGSAPAAASAAAASTAGPRPAFGSGRTHGKPSFAPGPAPAKKAGKDGK